MNKNVAASADNETAHTKAEKARQAWPISNTWRLVTVLSSTEENKELSLFSHILKADNADEFSAELELIILWLVWLS